MHTWLNTPSRQIADTIWTYSSTTWWIATRLLLPIQEFSSHPIDSLMMCYLQAPSTQTKSSNDGTTAYWTNHAGHRLRECWTGLCWPLVPQTWFRTQTNHLEVLRVCLCVDVRKSSSSRTCLWSHLSAKIYCQKRKVYVDMEWPWHQFCGSQSCTEGTTCSHTLPKNESNNTRILIYSRYRLAFHPWTCTSLWRSVGSSCEELQDSLNKSSWKF